MNKSENIVIEAPLSFMGSTKRVANMFNNTSNIYVKLLVILPIAICILSIVYPFIIMWYMFFGILIIPYRLLRRSQRKNKQAVMQHRELMEAVKNVQTR